MSRCCQDMHDDHFGYNILYIKLGVYEMLISQGPTNRAMEARGYAWGCAQGYTIYSTLTSCRDFDRSQGNWLDAGGFKKKGQNKKSTWMYSMYCDNLVTFVGIPP